MRLSRLLTLTAFSLVLLTPPAFARGHSAVLYRASYQHYRDRAGATSSHRDAVSLNRRFTPRRRNVYAFAPRQQQQDFGDFRSFDGYSKTYTAWFSGPYSGGRYEERWNGTPAAGPSFGEQSQLQSMAEQAASANGIPVSLVERVIRRESGGNSRAVSRGNYGLMQIRLGTARAMGYGGSAQGLLDPATNVTYAVRYLAGAYRAAGGNENRAVALYARGYNATPRFQDAGY
jgi:soluble lytic murein transglycosylase-like protein